MPHRRTLHYEDSSSELPLPKISKERTFEIESEHSLWTPVQAAHFPMGQYNLEKSPYSELPIKTTVKVIAALS